MKKRAFLIHGWEGVPEEGWRPWLKNELEKESFEVIVPAMPDTNYPKITAWVPHLIKTVGKPTENDYFVGHSLGCITILRYLETLDKKEKISGSVLVAGFSDDLGYQELKGFFETPINWSKIKGHCEKFVAIMSDNDPYVPLRHGDVFHKQLGARVVIEHNRKHFSGGDGVAILPSAKEAILTLAKS